MGQDRCKWRACRANRRGVFKLHRDLIAGDGAALDSHRGPSDQAKIDAAAGGCVVVLHRDVDVLIQSRKSSEYVLTQLVPALQACCNVVLLETYVDDLIGLFNRTKVYLYDSAEYWGRYRLTEGFGLPPMEALACGCEVYSSVNHALADYLDPGFNCHKISGFATGYDVQRILQSVHNWQSANTVPASFFATYRPEALTPRLKQILLEINTFFDYQTQHNSDIPQLTRTRITQLTFKRMLKKLAKR